MVGWRRDGRRRGGMVHASAARPGQRAANQVTRQLRRTILTEVGLRHCRVGCAPRPTETTVLHGGKKLGQPGSLGADEASCRETTPCLHLGPRRKKNVGRASRQTKRSLLSRSFNFWTYCPTPLFSWYFVYPSATRVHMMIFDESDCCTHNTPPRFGFKLLSAITSCPARR